MFICCIAFATFCVFHPALTKMLSLTPLICLRVSDCVFLTVGDGQQSPEKPLHPWVSSERLEKGPCQMPSPLACGVEVHVCLYMSFITSRINWDSCGI